MWSNDHPSNYKKAIIWLIPNMPVKCLLSLCVKLNAKINELLYISGVITCDSQALVRLHICFYYSLVGICNQMYFLCAVTLLPNMFKMQGPNLVVFWILNLLFWGILPPLGITSHITYFHFNHFQHHHSNSLNILYYIQ